jgi:hypothetical protein
MERIIIWMNNCSAQNKNWALITFLVFIINSSATDIQEINFKYFEPGHRFMSADSFHHQVKLSMKKKNSIYNYLLQISFVRSER